jgi:Flp pilus assembly protein TadB
VVIALAVVGALMGAVILALIRYLFPPEPSALITLGRYDASQQDSRPDQRAPTGSGAEHGHDARAWRARLGRRLDEQLQRRGVPYTSLRQDLALTGRSYETTLTLKALAFAAGFVIAAATLIALPALTGLGLPTGTPGGVALIVGAVFFVLPDLEARSEARARRRDFRRALGAYLDLVALEMAGAAAPAEALPNAARIGSGWAMALLRDTLYRATTAGRDPWLALAELGERIAVPELRDLGALVRLVGQDGAQVRETLTARAATMRRRELAEAEGEAGERDQSMQMAQLVIGFAFIVFLGYPAIAAVMVL